MCKLGLELAKKKLNLKILYATVDPKNIKSLKLHKRIGFKYIKESSEMIYFEKKFLEDMEVQIHE